MFEEIITNFIKLSDIVEDSSEFEIRFGTYRSNNFDTNVDISFFYRLKKYLKLNNPKYVINKYTDYFYNNSKGDTIRFSKYENEKCNSNCSIVKKIIKTYNEYNYDIRFNLSQEMKTTDNLTVNDMNDAYLIRKKMRYSWEYQYGMIDITKIYETDKKKDCTKIKYEVEFEISKKILKELHAIYKKKQSSFVPSEENSIQGICNIIIFILQIKQDNFHIISKTDYNMVLSQYKNLSKSSYFIGVQPETLQQDNLKIFYNELYAVSHKTDGERCFLFINNNQEIYFIDSNLNILKTNIILKSDYKSIIIDGELIRENGSINYVAFDILIYNEHDLRGNIKYDLKNRLDIVEQVIYVIQSQLKSKTMGANAGVVGYFFSCKTFILKNVFLGTDILLNEKNLKNDGLIFTPINEPYPNSKKWNKLLKWKPKDQNTIDFLSKKKENNEWELYIQTLDINTKQVKSILFDINSKDLKTNIISIDTLYSIDNKQPITTFKTSFDDTYIDPTTLESFQSDTVIEYKWDYILSKFIPIKTRWDKTVNIYKQGNFSNVACSIWNNIMNPIDPETFYKLKNLNSRNDIYFKNMRKHHNKIKEKLYNTYCNNINSLIELCSGKGGDINKWEFNQIKNIYGYDISSKNLDECNNRYNELKKKTNQKLNYNFYNMDLSCKNVDIIIKQQTQNVDVICCHFAIHYFLESERHFENFIKIIDSCLDNNGIFIISYMDSLLLHPILKANNNFIYKINNGNIVYSIKHTNTSLGFFGNKIKMYLDGNNILNEISEEYLVNSNFLLSYMTKRGYTCIESKYFKDINPQHSLNEYETFISNLYIYSVFKKTNDINKPYTNIKYTISKHSQDTIQLNQINNGLIDINSKLSLYKIQNINQIINIINCYEHTIYDDSLNKLCFDIDLNQIDNNCFIKQLDIYIQIIDCINQKSIVENIPLKNTIYLFKTYYTLETHYYIIFNNYQLFYSDTLDFFNILSCWNKKPSIEDKKITNIQQNDNYSAPSNASVTGIDNDNNKHNFNENNCNILKIDPIENTNNVLKKDIIKILNEKPTIKKLKECITNINHIHKKNIKTTGTKDELI